MVSTSIHIGLDGQKVDSLNLENIPVIPATDKGTEKTPYCWRVSTPTC